MATQPKLKPVPLVVSEIRRIAVLLDTLGAALHAGSPASAAGRDVLAELVGGPATVPDLARRRGVSRQNVQALADELLAAGLVERRDNPAHRRSSLIALTEAGAALLRAKEERERPVGTALAATVSEEDAVLVAAALERLRGRLETMVSPSRPPAADRGRAAEAGAPRRRR